MGERESLAQFGDLGGGILGWRSHGADYTFGGSAGDGAAMSSVLLLAPYVPHPLTHGGSIRTRLLLDAIAVDHEAHLIAPVVGDDDRHNLAALAASARVRAHGVPAPAPRRSGLVGKLRAWARGRSELLDRRWGADAVAAVAAIAAELRPAAIVADSSFVLPVVPPGPAPLALHLHNLEGGVFARSDGPRRPWRERMTRRCEARAITALETQALRRAHTTITVSDLDRDNALRLCPGAHVVTVPVTVDVARLVPLPPRSVAAPLRLLFVGTMDYPPNLEAVAELVDAHLPVLRAAFPGLVVRLVGRADHGELDVFRGREGVEVVGTVHDVQPHYAASDAVYLPIRTGGGTRGKIVEAWTLGRPVLSTAIGAEALAGVEGRHWLRFETPAEGVAAVRAVLAGAGVALAQAGRALAERQYDHTVAFAALRDIVRAVTAGR